MTATGVTHGADIAALRAWGAGAADGGRVLEEIGPRLGRALAGVGWSGPDQRRFTEDWNGRLAPLLTSVGSALTAASTSVGREADEQEITSAATPWGGSAPSVSGGSPTPTGGAPLGHVSDPAADAAREAAEAAWARGAGGVLLGGVGAAVAGPAGGLLGAVVGPHLVDRMVGVADARADRTSVTDVTNEITIIDRAPQGPGDVLHDMADMYDHPGTVRADLLTGPDGRQVGIVYVSGTQDWSGDSDGSNPMGVYGAVGAAAGKDTPLNRLALEAMATLPPDVPIHFATHSQGSFVALDLAADPYVRSRYTIASVITTGAGGGNFAIPDTIQVVSARNPFDPVARIGGAPSGAIDVTGSWSNAHPHSSREYAAMVARSDNPALARWWRETGIDPRSTVSTRVFRGTPDSAGRKATARTWDLLPDNATRHARAAHLPLGADPAKLVEDGHSALLAGSLRGAALLRTELIDHALAAQDLASIEQALSLARHVATFTARDGALDDPIVTGEVMLQLTEHLTYTGRDGEPQHLDPVTLADLLLTARDRHRDGPRPSEAFDDQHPDAEHLAVNYPLDAAGITL